MASVSSLDQDLVDVRRSKYDAKSVDDARAWIERVLGAPLPAGDLLDVLHDGTVLCQLATRLGAPARAKASRMPFVQMENISAFLTAAKQLGLADHDLFLTVDLYEAKDPAQVLQTLYAVSRHAAARDPAIPVLGPRLAPPAPPPKPRSMAARAAAAADGPAWNTHQYGYMGGASQGSERVVYGARRDIVFKPK
ncbi:Transgelin [Dipodascopsis tothii]|uniref:Transgelin n=1 Tax=Dipodascopsis tothii TaxID=44089 RepID=UPI0034CD2F04